METGKVEYAPDYKSKSERGRITAQSGMFRVTERNLCGGCGTPYTFSNAQAVKTLDCMRFCSPACERNPDVEREHARLKDAVVEAAKRSANKGVGQSCTCEDCKSYNSLVRALIAFEAEHKIGE